MIAVKKTKITEATTSSIVNGDRNYTKRVFRMPVVFIVIKTGRWLERFVKKISVWRPVRK